MRSSYNTVLQQIPTFTSKVFKALKRLQSKAFRSDILIGFLDVSLGLYISHQEVLDAFIPWINPVYLKSESCMYSYF